MRVIELLPMPLTWGLRGDVQQHQGELLTWAHKDMGIMRCCETAEMHQCLWEWHHDGQAHTARPLACLLLHRRCERHPVTCLHSASINKLSELHQE
jgi:hypothetical protein